MSKTKFYFVRHGETDRNALGKLPGGEDSPLNETGRKQATETGKNITQTIHVAYSSPLLRAKQTKDIITSIFGNSIDTNEIDERISEVDFGALRGRTWEDAKEFHDDDIKELYRIQEYDFTHHGGDSFHTVKNRLYAFIKEMKKLHPGKNILVVTHAGVIRVLYKSERDFVFERAPGHAEVHEFEF